MDARCRRRIVAGAGGRPTAAMRQFDGRAVAVSHARAASTRTIPTGASATSTTPCCPRSSPSASPATRRSASGTPLVRRLGEPAPGPTDRRRLLLPPAPERLASMTRAGGSTRSGSRRSGPARSSRWPAITTSSGGGPTARTGDRRIQTVADARRRAMDGRVGARTGVRRHDAVPVGDLHFRTWWPGTSPASRARRRPDARTARALPRTARPGVAGAREQGPSCAGVRAAPADARDPAPVAVLAHASRYDLAFVSRQFTSDGALGLFADRLLTIELPDLPGPARADTVTFVCRRAKQMPSPLRIGLVLICTGVALG